MSLLEIISFWLIFVADTSCKRNYPGDAEAVWIERFRKYHSVCLGSDDFGFCIHGTWQFDPLGNQQLRRESCSFSTKKPLCLPRHTLTVSGLTPDWASQIFFCSSPWCSAVWIKITSRSCVILQFHFSKIWEESLEVLKLSPVLILKLESACEVHNEPLVVCIVAVYYKVKASPSAGCLSCYKQTKSNPTQKLQNRRIPTATEQN